LDKIAENQSWLQDKAQQCHQTEEIPKEVKALSTKMENLLHWIDQRAKFKKIKGPSRQHTNINLPRVNPIAKV